MTAARFAQRAADVFAHPASMLAVFFGSHAALAMFGAGGTTFELSVLALNFSQLILVAGAADTRAIQAKLDELVRALPEASDDVIGIEKP